MRTIGILASVCAIAALILACFSGDPWSSLSGDNIDDPPVTVELASALPATRAEPPIECLLPVGSVSVEHQPPHARQTTLEVFRPPRARV